MKINIVRGFLKGEMLLLGFRDVKMLMLLPGLMICTIKKIHVHVFVIKNVILIDASRDHFTCTCNEIDSLYLFSS